MPSTTTVPAPLLSICIPTFNRAPFLAELLETLLPQLPALGEQVELLLSDNASTDNTPQVVASFQQRGLRIRSIRNPENLGADGNFLQCLSLATGRYLWLLGDDDLPTPHAVPQLVSLLLQGEQTAPFDLVYLSSFGFSGQLPADLTPLTTDRFGRFAEVVTDGAYLLEKVNALIGLISVVIINRERLLSTPHPPLDSLRSSNLLQLGFIFPLLHGQCRVLFLWQRLLGYRHFNSGGWGICEVFGLRLHRIAQQYFAAEPRLARALMNGVLRYWLPDSIMLARSGHEQAMLQEPIVPMLQPVFRGNWRFWLCVVPVARLPLPMARLWHTGLRLANRATRIGQAFFRHLVHRGELLAPELSAGESPALAGTPTPVTTSTR